MKLQTRLEFSGFLRSSADRGATSTTLVAGLETEGKSRVFEAKANVQMSGYLVDADSMTPESEELYLATRAGFFGHHQFTLGRRKLASSELDRRWGLGLWSPQFRWEPFRTQEVGLTGLFYQFETRRWKIVVQGSPVSLPERSYPILVQNGLLTSPSPFWTPTYEQVSLLGQQVRINTALAMPALSELLLRPQSHLSVRYGEDKGFWVSGAYGYGAANQLVFGLDAALDASTLEIKSTLHPARFMRHVGSIEAGYKAERAAAWLSGSYESPEQVTWPSSWVSRSPERATFIAGGLEFKPLRALRTGIQYLKISSIPWETPAADSSAPAVGAESIPSRFVYNQALEIRLDYDGTEKINYGFRWLADLDQKSQLFSLDVGLRATPSVRLTGGLDLYASGTGAGSIGQLLGNDRIRGGLAYDF